ncbi:MAG: LUD domain-containing protein [Chloroflexi bacterium]|nr:LUD domain-containing protein [Chloroflexota bacterium]
MDAREQILGKLRKAQQPFTDVKPIADRRPMIPMADLSSAEQLRRFISEAEALGCFVYQVTSNEAIEQIMELIDGDKTVLSWDEQQLPMDGLQGMLESLGVAVGRHDDGDARVGITGVTAALAATGSLILESGAGSYRSTSLLPEVHIALMRAEQILLDLESWEEAQRREGYPAFTRASNTTIVSGPSKTADIAHQLVKGAHGPREVHVMILR